ncbi:uncharacterized protein LOC120110620 [Phoenix dactylifera]|uniref:Uncharacterized protein LOC120110620 n=1 Tax=Phoenix dactylifera TaxID=42345 RepID=A0A8B9A643_PHODC|nr:uncharacterized protein LOC120110620 [Phoenix dactylifera]
MESGGDSNNQKIIEAIEGSSARLGNVLERMMETLTEMRRESTANAERLEGRNGERESNGSDGLRNERRRRGSRSGREETFERWADGIHEEDRPRGYEGEESEPQRSPLHRRPYGRREREERRRREEDDDRVSDRHDRIRKPKIDFPTFGGGDPYEWLDRVEQYFLVYEIPREEKVTLASYHLEGRANRWWRWLRNLYAREENPLGWTEFMDEFLKQWGPSPTINHHGQLAKLKQEGKVHDYIDQFRQLQTMVEGWSEEALLGTFVVGLKPWLSKEIKLKQPTKLQEAMRMAEIMDQNTFHDRRPTKESSNHKDSKPLPMKPQKSATTTSKPPQNEVRKLNREELQEYIKKGLCFKCGNKWEKGHQCKPGQSFAIHLVSSEDEADTSATSSSEDSTFDEEDEATRSAHENAEVSLHALSGVQRPSTMRMMAWIGRHEVSLLVDNGSSHNFINPDALRRIGLKGVAIEPFDVKITSGDRLQCQSIVKDVRLNVQGVRIMADLHVLQLVGLDVVLGNAWLRSISKVITDYKTMTMEFKVGTKKKLWTALHPKEVRPCEANLLERLCRGGALCLAVVMANQGGAAGGPQPQPSEDMSNLPLQVRRLLEAHQKVLEQPTHLPPQRSFDHPIRLKDESKPINVPPYRYAHFQKGEIERQVEEMMKQGLIRPSTSPFSSPVLLVRKKDGSWRFCTDYRALNEATIKDRFPIPTVDKMLDELHGARYFTRLDLRAGYHQIRMKEEDIHKTAFRTHSGHYEYLVMPFGLCNAPSTFQAAMNKVFKLHLRKFVIVFFDDILVYSKSKEEHMKHLDQVLSILEEHNFYIKPSKCAFMQEELEYLGHIVSGQGVMVDPRKIEAMTDWPLPKDISALRGFLGLTGYYRRFVRDYGLIAKPLTNMLKKDGFEWTPTAKQAFEELKRAMTQTPVLALPNFSQPFEVYMDASNEGIGAVLAQNKRPLAYISKALGPQKKAWSTYAREMLAVVHVVKIWRPYLLGRRFTIVTDQQALRHLLTQKIVTPYQQKFLVKLLGFEYDIIYQPGKENKVADALSRKEGSPVLDATLEDKVSPDIEPCESIPTTYTYNRVAW